MSDSAFLEERDSWNPRPRLCDESALIVCPFCRDEEFEDGCPLCSGTELIDPNPNIMDIYVMSLMWGQADDNRYVVVSNEELAETLGWEAMPSVFYLMAKGIIDLGYLKDHPTDKRSYWRFSKDVPFDKHPAIWESLVAEGAVDLATMPYAEYLRTDHWNEVRSAARERANHRCQLCNRKGELHTHHRTYERRGSELPEDVIVLCKDCHSLFHQYRDVGR